MHEWVRLIGLVMCAIGFAACGYPPLAPLAQLGDDDGGTTVTTSLCHPVINELTTGTSVSPADEWVEVYNPCTNAVDVTDWTLVYRAASNIGSADSSLLMTLAGQMAPGELRLYAGPGYSGVSDGTWLGMNGLVGQVAGGVGLRSGATGPLVDSVAYGSVAPTYPFIETNPMPAMANGKSASRLPVDGNDTNDGAADFLIIPTPTPRALNAP